MLKCCQCEAPKNKQVMCLQDGQAWLAPRGQQRVKPDPEYESHRLQVELQDRRNLVAMRGSLAEQRAANAQRESRFVAADARRAELQARICHVQ